jgi:hypothetical protein
VDVSKDDNLGVWGLSAQARQIHLRSVSRYQ